MARLVLLGVAEAAEEAGVTRRTVYKWIQQGLGGVYLPAVRLRGGVYYTGERDLEYFLVRRRRNGRAG